MAGPGEGFAFSCCVDDYGMTYGYYFRSLESFPRATFLVPAVDLCRPFIPKLLHLGTGLLCSSLLYILPKRHWQRPDHYLPRYMLKLRTERLSVSLGTPTPQAVMTEARAPAALNPHDSGALDAVLGLLFPLVILRLLRQLKRT